MLQHYGYGASASCNVLVYAAAVAGTYCPQGDSQVELVLLLLSLLVYCCCRYHCGFRRIVFKNCDERQPAATQIRREAEQLQQHFNNLIRKPAVCDSLTLY